MVKKIKYPDQIKKTTLMKENIKKNIIITKARIQNIWTLTKLLTKTVLMPALMILLILTLLGYKLTILNYLASICVYFGLEELKQFIKEMKE